MRFPVAYACHLWWHPLACSRVILPTDGHTRHTHTHTQNNHNTYSNRAGNDKINMVSKLGRQTKLPVDIGRRNCLVTFACRFIQFITADIEVIKTSSASSFHKYDLSTDKFMSLINEIITNPTNRMLRNVLFQEEMSSPYCAISHVRADFTPTKTRWTKIAGNYKLQPALAF